MKKFRLLMIVTLLFFASSAIAQEKGDRIGNGGKTDEIDFITHLTKIGNFLSSSHAGKNVFFEVDAASYVQRMGCLKVRFVNERPVDKFGNPRDAVNYPSECAIEVYAPAWHFLQETPQAKFSFAFHEILGLLGIETLKSKFKEVDYHLSSRITPFVGYKNEIGLIDLPLEMMKTKQEYKIACFEDDVFNRFGGGSTKKLMDIYLTYFPLDPGEDVLNKTVAPWFSFKSGSPILPGEDLYNEYYLGNYYQYPKLKKPNHIEMSLSQNNSRRYQSSISLDLNPSEGVSDHQWRGTFFKFKLTGPRFHGGSVQQQLWPVQKDAKSILCRTEKITNGVSSQMSEDDYWLLKNLMNESRITNE